nr:12633_t:CDS:2 [Entrophospora candida]
MEYPVEEFQTQTGDYKLFEDTESEPSVVTDSELINLSGTDEDRMSEEETASQAAEEDLITLEEDTGEQPEITPYFINSESSDTSGKGSSKIIQEEESMEGNQEKDRIENQETKEEDKDTNSEEDNEIVSNSTISDEDYNKITQEPISSYYINSDQESDTERLESKEEEEIQLSGINNLRVMTTTINLNPTIKDILTETPSMEMGPTGGGILGKLEKVLGEYDCWVPGCKNKVWGKYTKCQTCDKCEHEGCTRETYNQYRWCGECWLRCKRPHCFKVGRVGGNNCEEHQSEEPVPCAWMGCGNKSENNRGLCRDCQEKSDKMCDTPRCYQPRCKTSDLYCQGCWEKNMKGNTTKSTTKGISSNTTTGSGSSEGPLHTCILNACIKKVNVYGEKCFAHKYCGHEGCMEEAPFIFRYCKKCQMCCRAKNCFNPRERDEAYCYNHRTKERVQCAIADCHEKAGG